MSNFLGKAGWSMATAVLALALLAGGPADAKQKRKAKPAADATPQSDQSDLPVPTPGSMGGKRSWSPANDATAGPPDISGGNGQMLTRGRNF
jgi:hypothetical protein